MYVLYYTLSNGLLYVGELTRKIDTLCRWQNPVMMSRR